MTIYVYLSTADKKEIVKRATKHQLSFSTFIALVTRSYIRTLNVNELTKYIAKGDKKIHCKCKLWKIEKMSQWHLLMTNCIWKYLHEPNEESNRELQSLCDTTEDPHWDYNHYIRNFKKYEREQK